MLGLGLDYRRTGNTTQGHHNFGSLLLGFQKAFQQIVEDTTLTETESMMLNYAWSGSGKRKELLTRRIPQWIIIKAIIFLSFFGFMAFDCV